MYRDSRGQAKPTKKYKQNICTFFLVNPISPCSAGSPRRNHPCQHQHRRKQAFLGSRLANYVVSTFHPGGVGFIKGMTEVERHAELVYAESMFEKALLGIVYSGDWLAFIEEAYVVFLSCPSLLLRNKPLLSLNMRTIAIYRQLRQFLDHMDATYTTSLNSSKSLCHPPVDSYFRSGVFLGVGMCNIILSMMSGKLIVVELFGYKGDRMFAL
jgi:hypothetical protein